MAVYGSLNRPERGPILGGRRRFPLERRRSFVMRIPPRRTAPLLCRLLGGQLYPSRRMVAGFLPPAHLLVHARVYQPIGKRGAKKQMVDPKAGVPVEGVPKIVPEGLDGL